jgi:hypothetical protein
VSGFQALALASVAALALYSLYSGWSRGGSRASAVLWLGVWSAAAFFLLHPDWTQRLARSVGIQRGADLVFYCAVIAMLGGFFAVSLRLRQHSRETTLITRHLALRDVLHPPQVDPEPEIDSDAWDERG